MRERGQRQPGHQHHAAREHRRGVRSTGQPERRVGMRPEGPAVTGSPGTGRPRRNTLARGRSAAIIRFPGLARYPAPGTPRQAAVSAVGHKRL